MKPDQARAVPHPVLFPTAEAEPQPQRAAANPLRWLYGTAIFTSAFLLFQVQPVIAKIILPWFGGVAAVWAVCLLFFQSALLLGYVYAHLLTKWLSSRNQRWLHLVLLAGSLLALPIVPKVAWRSLGPQDPAAHILIVLGLSVGLPYFVLSSTSPLLQAWYAESAANETPYRFFAVSNAGSMLGLLSYPVLVEPWISNSHQAKGWSLLYGIAAILIAAIALRRPLRSTEHPLSENVQPPSWNTRLLWVALSACGSALLLGVTNHITQNIASVPFLWILPLSLYLLSFIVCFAQWNFYRKDFFLRLLGVALGAMAYSLSPYFAVLPLGLLLLLFCGGLFVCCVFCHGELARLKPHPAYLTSFYLMISLGGALGSAFVGLVAPHVFRWTYELQISLGACVVLALIVNYRDPQSRFYRARFDRVWLVVITLAAGILACLGVTIRDQAATARVMERNFYGTLRVLDQVAPNVVMLRPDGSQGAPLDPHCRKLMNGTINHGLQFTAPSRRREPVSYYPPNSGIGVALKTAAAQGPIRIGVIGLGTGTIAAYGKAGDDVTFYEINPLVVDLAHREFTFLDDSPAAVHVVMGDARLSLESEPSQQFDVLAVDAFSGDSIPVHLLTREAFAEYLRHLKSRGVLVIHISNQHLRLLPVVHAAADQFGLEAVVVENDGDSAKGIAHATWIVAGRKEGFAGQAEIEKAGAVLLPGGKELLWTDDYSGLLKILK